jgi:hypothetical protein
MDNRQADVDDVPTLIVVRKEQLPDEGLGPVADIDRELMEYSISGLGDAAFVSWVALDQSNIVRRQMIIGD